jgi:hypothetical protein
MPLVYFLVVYSHCNLLGMPFWFAGCFRIRRGLHKTCRESCFTYNYASVVCEYICSWIFFAGDSIKDSKKSDFRKKVALPQSWNYSLGNCFTLRTLNWAWHRQVCQRSRRLPWLLPRRQRIPLPIISTIRSGDTALFPYGLPVNRVRFKFLLIKINADRLPSAGTLSFKHLEINTVPLISAEPEFQIKLLRPAERSHRCGEAFIINRHHIFRTLFCQTILYSHAGAYLASEIELGRISVALAVILSHPH